MIARTSLAAFALVGFWGEPLRTSALQASDRTTYRDASVSVDGELLDWHFADVEGEGRSTLVLGVRTNAGRRELQFHRVEADSIAAAPYARIEVPFDTIAWTLVRTGATSLVRRVVLLTRERAWLVPSLDAGAEPEVLCDIELLYDLPTPRALPFWSYVIPTRSGDLCLLPSTGGFRLYGTAKSDAPDPSRVRVDTAAPGPVRWEPKGSFESPAGAAPIDPLDGARRTREAERDRREKEARLSRTLGETVPPFLGATPGLGPSPSLGSSAAGTLLDAEARIQAPGLVDVNGDGWLDLLHLVGDELRVHLGSPDGPSATPTRVEQVPDYLSRSGRAAALRIVDLDGDGRPDILGIWGEKADVLENSEWRVFALRSTEGALLPAKPSQVLRFAAGEFRVDVANIDGDGLPDLTVRQFEWPTALQAITGVRFRYSQLLFPGQAGGGFARRPAMRQTEDFDERSVQAAFASRALTLDCDGDRVADLVEAGLDGALQIRRLSLSKSVFGSERWSLESEPWQRFSNEGSMTSLAVVDLNGDALGDVVSATDRKLHVYPVPP